MQIKILQLNMWAGRQFPVLKDFLSKNTFDILCFQEVVTRNPERMSNDQLLDYFIGLQEVLGDNFAGKRAIHTTFDSNSLFTSQANATFYRKDFQLLDEQVLWLHKREKPFPGNATSFEDMGRSALHLTLSVAGKTLDVVNAHLAWAPTPLEQPHERAQNVKLIDYVKNLQHPFLLTGDFNIQYDQPSILELEQYGRDLTKEYGITSTLDETLHSKWDVIGPGFPVDYIFVSPNLKVSDFDMLSTVHMADHYGLTATIEV